MTNCLFCGEYLVREVTWATFLWRAPKFVICTSCEEQLVYSKSPDAIYFHNAFMNDVIHQYKFQKDLRVAHFFAEGIRKEIKKRKFDAVVPIPMHPKKEIERTFAHVEVVLKFANIPFQTVLQKNTEEQQSKKSKKEREQMTQFFSIIEEVDLRGKRLLLIDDILTTGTTIALARQLLLEAGAEKVEMLTFISCQM
ncbi:MAG TPA: phosphoribosyltransferase family protein [Kurthia sp.]